MTSELPEVMWISDRIVVMREGRIVAVHENQNLTAETLVMAAAGIAERAA